MYKINGSHLVNLMDKTKLSVKFFFMSQVSFLDNQLEIYIHDMQSIEEFSAFRGIGQLVKKMVEIKKKKCFISISLLISDFGIDLTSCNSYY